MTCDWVKICRHGLDFSKAWKQSHEEEQKSSFLSEHLNYNMLKGYYGIFAKLCQEELLIYLSPSNVTNDKHAIVGLLLDPEHIRSKPPVAHRPISHYRH